MSLSFKMLFFLFHTDGTKLCLPTIGQRPEAPAIMADELPEGWTTLHHAGTTFYGSYLSCTVAGHS